MSSFSHQIKMASGEIITLEVPRDEEPFSSLLTPPNDISGPSLSGPVEFPITEKSHETQINPNTNPEGATGGAIKRTYRPREKRSIDPKFGKEMTHIDHQTNSSYR